MQRSTFKKFFCKTPQVTFWLTRKTPAIMKRIHFSAAGYPICKKAWYKIIHFQDRVKLNQLSNLLHDALIATENVDRCAIIERRDGEQKAGSPGFTVRVALAGGARHRGVA